MVYSLRRALDVLARIFAMAWRWNMWIPGKISGRRCLPEMLDQGRQQAVADQAERRPTCHGDLDKIFRQNRICAYIKDVAA